MRPRTDVYNDYAAQYAEYITRGSGESKQHDPFGLIPRMVGLLGPVNERQMLDAGCGEGILARELQRRGARVVAADIAGSLVEFGKAQDTAGRIEFHVRDLSQPIPEWRERFDAIGSRFVLNDVPDYVGFISTLATVLKPGGRAVFAFNNPYSAVLRGKVADYFETGTVRPYDRLWGEGIAVFHYHRTMAEYLDAFLGSGFDMLRLIDIPRVWAPEEGPPPPAPTVVPFLMILSMQKR